ncbi:MAG: adenylate/guanylate cyclase domain-containing protein [Chthonomonas sp.]|nr:adenylate/guanylate cyclase domain-containing protein [Chthonomonas sp.]
MRKRRVSLVSALLTAILVPLLATALVLSISTFLASRRSVSELNSALMSQAMRGLEERVGRMVDQATATADKLGPDLKSLQPANFEAKLGEFESELRVRADLTYISFGLESGEYAHVYRRPDGRLERQQCLGGFRTDYIWRGAREEVRRQATTYDPRERPYYQLAKAERRAVWTPVYKFITPTGQTELGVTFAVPILNQSGRLAGVLSVDFTLNTLSDYLRSFTLAETGYGAIFDRRTDLAIVAHPARSLLGTPLAANPKLGAIPIDILAGNLATDFTFSYGGEQFSSSVSVLKGRNSPPWGLLTVVPESELLGNIRRAERNAALAGLVAISCSALLGWLISRRVTKPLREITQDTENIRNLELDSDEQVQTSITEIATLASAVHDMKSSIKSFGKFVPGNYVRQLIESGEEARLAGEKVVLTASFTDIAGFTSLCEHMAPEDAVMVLSLYLTALTECVQKTGGTVDKYIGDEVLAFWRGEDHAARAVEAALLCQDAFAELATDMGQNLRIRVGISTGEAVVGTMGSPERLNYTVIGDTINLGKRLESSCDALGAKILASEATMLACATSFDWTFVAEIEVKGRTQRVRVHQPERVTESPR